jgi:hypothetical protein
MLVTCLLDYHSFEVLTTVCYHMLAANALHLQRANVTLLCHGTPKVPNTGDVHIWGPETMASTIKVLDVSAK